MAFGFKEILKGLRIVKEGTLTPSTIEISPNGGNNDKTTIQSQPVGADNVVTLPSETTTLVGTVDDARLENKKIELDTTEFRNSDDSRVLYQLLNNGVNNTITTVFYPDVTGGTSDITFPNVAVATLATTDELNNHITDSSDAHDASAISTVPSGNLAATDVQAALNELQSDIDTRLVMADLNAHVNDASDAHDASAISSVASGNLVATDVQAALNELQSDIDTRALDSAVVHKTGNETIGGVKQFTEPLTLDGQASTPANPSSGFYKAYVKDSTGKFTLLNSSGVESTIGAAVGGKNFVTNGDAEEASATIFTTYKDTVATRPVDGTGGSPTLVSSSIGTTSPLDGNKEYLLYKGSGNAQGEGFAITLDTISPSYRAKVLNIEFDYLVDSGSTFYAGDSSTDSSIIVYIYDVTNSLLIEPSSIKLLSSSTSNSDKFKASFQTSSTGSSYRLIFHVARTETATWQLKIDNIKVSPSEYAYGTPVTDWKSETRLTMSWVTTATLAAYSRRVGDAYEVQGRISLTGAATATALSITLPSGMTIDTNKLSGGTGSRLSLGQSRIFDSSAGLYFINGNITPNGTTNSVQFWATRSDGVYQDEQANVTNAIPMTFANSDYIDFKFSVPVTGWSSSVQMSDQADTRIVSFHGTAAGTTATANVTNLNFTTVKDSHNAWNGSTYTVPVAGDYNLSCFVFGPSTATLSAYVNGTEYRYITYLPAGAGGGSNILIPNLKVGDTLSVRNNTTQTFSSSTLQFLSISRLSGPNQIASNELVSARYTSNTAHSIAHAAVRYIDFEDKNFDSHSAVTGTGSGITSTTNTGWKFTAPISGTYQINASICIVIGTSTTYNCYLILYKNGVAVSSGVRLDGTTNTLAGGAIGASCYDYIQLSAGDRIEVGIVQSNGGSASKNLSGTDYQNYISITRVGF